METLLLVPLDDSGLPDMTATLAVDVGDEERVLARAAPRRASSPRSARSPRSLEHRARCPAAAAPPRSRASTAASPGAARTDADGTLRVEVTAHADDRARDDERTRELEREYRAVVEEILELRGADGRIGAFLRSITEPGALADTSGYSPDLSYEQKRRAARDARRHRAPREGARAAARAARRAAGPQRGSATTSRRAPRSSSASTSCASRWSRSARSSARTRPRSSTSTATKIEEAGMPDDVREQAEKELAPPRAHGRAVGRVAR